MKWMKVIQFGMGPLGQKTVQYLSQRKSIEIVGAIDVNPELLGRDVAEVAGCESIGVTIQSSTNSDLPPPIPNNAANLAL